MSKRALQRTLVRVFSSLRRNGFAISIGELLDGLRMVEGAEESVEPSSLQETLWVIWSRRNYDLKLKGEFARLWDAEFATFLVAESDAHAEAATEALPQSSSTETQSATTPAQVSESPQALESQQDAALEFSDVSAPENGSSEMSEEPTSVQEEPEESKPYDKKQPDFFKPSKPEIIPPYDPQKRAGKRFTDPPPIFRIKSDTPSPLPALGAMPVPVQPTLRPSNGDGEVYTYRPISRLSMAYAWRYLRRQLPDGPTNILDIEATISRVARQGFFLAPIYRRQRSNHAHLMLLIDHGSSMSPFESISRDLVETAREESSIKQVDVFYFHNFVTSHCYLDPYLTRPETFANVLDKCTTDTSILIVSDAGAARGNMSFDRIRETTQMLLRLKNRTDLIAWLNPMPKMRWRNSSAQMIALVVQMFQLDVDSFSSAVDTLQGRGTTL
jgi:uncharacterized protein with von Willebrand factor type A (vWA) domain